MSMTAKDLKRLIAHVPDDAILKAAIVGSTQVHNVLGSSIRPSGVPSLPDWFVFLVDNNPSTSQRT